MPSTSEKRCGGCDCGGCGTPCGAPPPPVSLRPHQETLPLRHVSGDEGCFRNAHLLVSACCGPFACDDFHQRFIRKRVTLIACPGDSGVNVTETLTAILTRNNILTVTVVRMESPCCDALETAAREALRACGKFIPWQVMTLGAHGDTIE